MDMPPDTRADRFSGISLRPRVFSHPLDYCGLRCSSDERDFLRSSRQAVGDQADVTVAGPLEFQEGPGTYLRLGGLDEPVVHVLETNHRLVFPGIRRPEAVDFEPAHVGRFHGRPLSELAAQLRDSHQSLLIAIYTEARALSLEDLLAEEPSAIDDFIRRKFAETKMTHLLGRTKVDYQVNPPGSTIMAPRQVAVVIAPQRPEL